MYFTSDQLRNARESIIEVLKRTRGQRSGLSLIMSADLMPMEGQEALDSLVADGTLVQSGTRYALAAPPPDPAQQRRAGS